MTIPDAEKLKRMRPDTVVGVTAGELSALSDPGLEAGPYVWPTTLTVDELQAASAQRSARWHENDTVPWTGADWSNEMGGEAGEAQNVVKKLRRIETGVASQKDDGSTGSLEAKLGEELADVVICAVNVATHYGLDLAAEIVAKFNAVSRREGFPERVGIGA